MRPGKRSASPPGLRAPSPPRDTGEGVVLAGGTLAPQAAWASKPLCSLQAYNSVPPPPEEGNQVTSTRGIITVASPWPEPETLSPWDRDSPP